MPQAPSIEKLISYLMEGKLSEKDLANLLKNQVYKNKSKNKI
jgi:hypothetical protein